MFVRVTMNFGVKDYVVVPDQAVVKQSGAGDRFIYVYKDGKVSYNKVEIGRQLGTTYEVISGVESGDQVVVAGQSRFVAPYCARLAASTSSPSAFLSIQSPMSDSQITLKR